MHRSMVTVAEFHSEAGEIQYVFESQLTPQTIFDTLLEGDIKNMAQFHKLSFLNLNKIEKDFYKICSPNLIF